MGNPFHRPPTPVACGICGRMINRMADMSRHLETHKENKNDRTEMFHCSWPGCTYATRQKSNLTPHENAHAGIKTHKCPAPGCKFSTSHPASLTRHRKEQHGYQPRRSSEDDSPAETQRTTRRRRRGLSQTLPDQSTLRERRGKYGRRQEGDESEGSPDSTRKATRQRKRASSYVIPEDQPSASCSPANANVEENIKNNSPGYNTQLVVGHAQPNDAYFVPTDPLDYASLTSGPGVSPASRSFVPEEGNLFTFAASAQAVNDGLFAPFNDWLPQISFSHTAPSLPFPLTQHAVDDAAVFTPTPHSTNDFSLSASLLSLVDSNPIESVCMTTPSPTYALPYDVNNVATHTSASWTLPAYDSQHTSSVYIYGGYGIADASFEAQFDFSQPDLFTMSDMVVDTSVCPRALSQSQAVYPRAIVDVSQNYVEQSQQGYSYATTGTAYNTQTSADLGVQWSYA